MNHKIKQVEQPDYDALIAELRDQQLKLAVAGRYDDSFKVAEQITRVRRARRRALRRPARKICSV